jgi:hypothetical protein
MKKIKLLITLFLIIQPLLAHSVVFVLNQHPVVGDEIVVYNYLCRPVEESIVDIDGQNINVFVRYGPAPPGTGCGSPPPPLIIALINGLSEGVYNLDSYLLFPPVTTFPPLPVDYPLHYDSSVQFEVFAAPVTVDSTSNLSLKLLFILILLIGLFVVKNNKNSQEA